MHSLLMLHYFMIIICKHNIVHNIIKKGKRKQKQKTFADIIINEKLKIYKTEPENIYKKRKKFVLGRKAERHDLSHSNLH